MTQTISTGTTYEVEYPFVREKVMLFDEDGASEIDSWRPGVRGEFVLPDDTEAVADGLGAMLLHVVDMHKPGRYPERVFFTRRWRDPEGKEFGKNLLHILSKQAFRRRLDGYTHDYRMSANK